ncbi:MAG: hypothetical protein IT384_09060 [Deltaproteobacteria bacterium]|nr:hypothetical protein [Deltaproteobacteria bacterium]
MNRRRASGGDLALEQSPFNQWSLGRVVAAWAEQGAPLPVAVVVSIFDDVCADLELGPAEAQRCSQPLGLDDVMIDQHGIARLTVVPDEPVAELSRLLYDTLAAGAGDGAVPAAARPLIEQSVDSDPLVRPPGATPVRAALRAALGPPARRDEVLGCCAAIEVPVPSAIEEMDTDPTSMARGDEGDTDLITASVILQDPARVEVAPLEPFEAAHPLPVPAEDLDPASLESLESRVHLEPQPAAAPRPVVRYEISKRPPVSLPAAPEARVGPAGLASDDRATSIILPSEGRVSFWLITILFMIAGGLLAWLLGLVEI